MTSGTAASTRRVPGEPEELADGGLDAAAAPPDGRPGPTVRRGVPLRAQQVLVVLAAVALWQAIYVAGVVSRQALSGPVDTVQALVVLLSDSAVWVEIGQTLLGWSLGLGIAFAIAVPLGVLLGQSRTAFRSSRFVVDFLRTIPALGIIPLASLLFGPTRSTELLVVVPACTWPLLLQTTYGVRDVEPLALETARSFNVRARHRLTRIVLPSATPFLATGLRIAAVTGMLLAISIELLVRVPGVGNGLARAQGNGTPDIVYAYTVLSALLGLAVVLVFARIERSVVHWHASQRTRG